MTPPLPYTGAQTWFTARRFALALALLVVAAFPEVTLGLKTFVHRDFGLFGYPLAHYHKDCFWRGEIPLWNPYNNAGLPFLAQWNTMVLYPGSLIYLLLPLPWSLNLFCLAHLFLAGLGMYRLAERWTGHRLAAAIAGVGFAFNGLTLNSLMWPNNIAALGWMPWVVCLVNEGWRQGGRRLVLASFAGALQMLTGAPEITLFTWLLLGAMWAGHWLRRSRPRAVLVGRGTAIAGLVAGLSAAQLLPFLDLLRHSHRDSGFATDAWAMPPWGWANFLVPQFHMIRSGSGLLYQPEQFWTSSYYVGLGVIALALCAMARLRQPRKLLLTAALLGSVVLALGDAGLVYRWLREGFPAANFMRFPIKYVVVAVFVLPILAAFAVRESGENLRRREQLSDRSMIVLWSALAVAIAAIVVWSRLDPLPVNPSDFQLTWHSGVTRLALLTAFLFALRWALAGVGNVRPWAPAVVLLVLIWFDALTHTAWQNPVAHPDVFGSVPAEARGLSPLRLGESRAAVSLAAMDEFYRRNSTNAAESLVARRLALVNNLNLLERIPKADGFFSLYLPGERAVHFRLHASEHELRGGLGDFLGAGQINAPSNNLAWASRATTMPWISAGQRPVFLDRASTLSNLTTRAFNPREAVFLPPDAAAVVPGISEARAQILGFSWSAHRIVAEVEVSGPTVIVFSQAHYHRWKATVDGRAIPIWQANAAFQAVPVTAGRHQVELRYRDGAFCIGLLVAGAVLLAAVVLWWRAGETRQSSSNSDASDGIGATPS